MLSFNERLLVDYCTANLAVDSQPIRSLFAGDSCEKLILTESCLLVANRPRVNPNSTEPQRPPKMLY